jgi:AcrR family transcriptional regulator
MAEAKRQGVPLSPGERRRRNRQEMIDGILAAARAVMREEGVAALNLNEVARRIRIRPQSLYEYFPSKAAVYDALFRLGTRLAVEETERVRETYPPDWSRIEGWLEGFLAFAVANPDLYQLTFERPVPGFVPTAESREESGRLTVVSHQVMREMIEAGVIRHDIPFTLLFDFFILVLHGLMSTHMANEPQLPAGSGRFGSLVPMAVTVLRAAWSADRTRKEGEDDAGD